KSNCRSWARKRWIWERLFSLGVATSPVILAASRARARVLRSTDLLIRGCQSRVRLDSTLSTRGERLSTRGERGGNRRWWASPFLQGEAGDRRGGCDVEGIDSPTHRDHHGRIAG